MSRARTLAGAIGSDGALNVADVAGLAAVASSGSASDLSTGTLPNARLASGAAVANLGYTPVNKAGDTFTGDVAVNGGRLSITGTHNASAPLVDFVASNAGAGAGNYLRGSRLLDSSMIAGQRIMYAMGRSDNSKNMGQVYFGYAGSGSDSNFIALGLHSVDEALQVMASGAVKMKYQPRFRVGAQGEATTYASGAVLKMASNEYDPMSCYDPSTGRFTVPTGGAGLYHFSYVVRLDNNPNTYGSYVRCRPFKNGAHIEFLCGDPIYPGSFLNNTTYASLQMSWNIELADGDYIDLRLEWVSGPSSQNISNSGWSGYLVA